MLVKIENILFAINKSDVHEPVDSDTYIGFGKAKNENLSAQSRASAAEQSTKHCHLHAGTDSEDQRDVDEADDDDTDEAIIEPKDIEVVTLQVSCSTSKAMTH